MLPTRDGNRFIVQVHVGALSTHYEALSVEASKQTTADEIVSCIVERLLLNEHSLYELTEVIGDDAGHECKERRLASSENPVQVMLLWPLNRTDKASYKFYLREKASEFTWSNQFVLDPQIIKDYFHRFLYQPKDREYPDLCQLPDLNEQTLLDNLRARFIAGHIYTYVGSILIAVNPFKFYPIYNPKYVKLYQNRRYNLPPHIFAVADSAYYCMLKYKKNQCIVISGESGSGKTESTNFLLHYLTALSQKGSHGSGVEQTILSAGPVLEAFGNAKTAHNNNSSRFGKFIQVNYKENGMVHGAVVQKYLLEKSRICLQGRNERNYHVFYYLLEGATEQEKQVLHLHPAEYYCYLNKSCYPLDNVDESYEFSRLKQSMEMVGFTADKQHRLFSVLSAILLLGNIEFQPRKSTYHHDESVSVKNADVVAVISHLLKVKQETLMQALLSKRARVSGETLVINYKLPEATGSRDAMAKCLYGAVFDWIVLQVNHALLTKNDSSRGHSGNSISVLDIFGFEDFGLHNCFEQLCINYANEHLQYYFNQHVFKYEQEEYKKDGIRWKNIDFMDNTGCLQLIEGKPNGLLCLLDDQCNFPGATNETLLQKFNTVHKCNQFYQKPQKKEGAFIIVHYAGKVKYQVTDMREKNLDLMRQDIVGVLKNSSMAFVRELVGVDPVSVFRWAILRAFFRSYFAFRASGVKYRQNRMSINRHNVQQRRQCHTTYESAIRKNRSFRPKERGNKNLKNLQTVKTITGRICTSVNQSQPKIRKQPMTVTAQFQQSLHALMDTLNQANPFFIRCIKSNGNKLPNQFDDETVQRQLNYTGMLETVRIRQAGFNVRLSYEEFIQLYRILLPKGLLSSQYDVRDYLLTLNLDSDHYQLGYTKIFLRESERYKLDCRLHQQIITNIVALQRWFRACLERRQFIKMKNAVIVIQSYCRMYLVQTHVKKTMAAVKIQQYWRAYRTFKWYKKLRQSIVSFQAHCKGYYIRQHVLRQFLDSHALLNVKMQINSNVNNTACPYRRGNINRLAKHKALRSAMSLPGAILELPLIENADKNRSTYSFEDLNKYPDNSSSSDIFDVNFIAASCAAYINEDSHTNDATESNKVGSLNPGQQQSVLNGKSTQINGQSNQPAVCSSSINSNTPSNYVFNNRSPVQLRNKLSTARQQYSSDNQPLSDYTSRASADGLCPNVQRSSYNNQPMGNGSQSEERSSTISSSPLSSFIEHDVMYTSNAGGFPHNDNKPEVPIRSTRKVQRSTLNVLKSDRYQCNNSHHSGAAALPAINKEAYRPLCGKTPSRIPQITPTANAKPKHAHHVGLNLSLRRRNSDPSASFLLPSSTGNNHIGKTATNNFAGGLTTKRNELPSPDDFKWQNTNTFTIAGHSFRKIHRIHKAELCTFCNDKMDPFITHIYKCLYCKKMFHTKCIQNKGVLQMPCNEHTGNNSSDYGKSNRRKQGKHSSRGVSETRRSDDCSNFSLTGTSEFTDRTDQIITGGDELTLMQQFIANKIIEIEKEMGDSPGEVDRLFKQALREFKDNLVQLYSAASKHGFDACSIRYKDLIENFMQAMETVCQRESKKTEHFPLTMGVNAFRGFMNEFMLSRNQDKPNKAKRKKEKKSKIETVKHKSHVFQLTIINIQTVCEVCNSFFMWPIERGLVCQLCKLTCHKKCCPNVLVTCKEANVTSERHSVFGAPLITLITEENKIPIVIEKLVRTIEMHGLYTEGIYRKSGASSKIKELKQQIDEKQDKVDFEQYHVHVLASVLKCFLREMPEPLLTFECYENFITAADLNNNADRVATLYDILNKLPRINYDLMERLMFHLARVALHEKVNRMSEKSLAIVFAPCILRTNKIVPAQHSLQDIGSQTRCIATIIKEQLVKIRSTLDEINTLDKACQTATNRLSSLRSSKSFSPEDDCDANQSLHHQSNADEEEHILEDHIEEIQKEKEHLASTLPTLLRTMSDDDMLSTDGDGSLDDISYIVDGGRKIRPAQQPHRPIIRNSEPAKFTTSNTSSSTTDVRIICEDPVMV